MLELPVSACLAAELKPPASSRPWPASPAQLLLYRLLFADRLSTGFGFSTSRGARFGDGHRHFRQRCFDDVEAPPRRLEPATSSNGSGVSSATSSTGSVTGFRRVGRDGFGRLLLDASAAWLSTGRSYRTAPPRRHRHRRKVDQHRRCACISSRHIKRLPLDVPGARLLLTWT